MSYSYVYFITDGNGHIKIGKADDISERLKELQTGNPYKLKILLTVMLKNMNQTFELENKLHKKLKKYRMEGEWFEAEPVLKIIDSEIVELDNFRFGGLRYGRVERDNDEI